ncbi:MAG: hypothetical protein LUC22_07095 [Prevotella sp.]|nr:hypothetical protein [Prevotella sp.]
MDIRQYISPETVIFAVEADVMDTNIPIASGYGDSKPALSKHESAWEIDNNDYNLQ